MLAARKYGYARPQQSCGDANCDGACSTTPKPKQDQAVDNSNSKATLSSSINDNEAKTTNKNKRSWLDTFSACCTDGSCEKKRKLPTEVELSVNLAECCRICWDSGVCCGQGCCELVCCLLGLKEKQPPSSCQIESEESEEDDVEEMDDQEIDPDEIGRVVFEVSGITCADCSLRLEKRLRKKKGILQVQISAVTSKAEIVYNMDKLSEEDIEEAIEGAGFGAERAAPASSTRITLQIQHHDGDDEGDNIDSVVERVKEEKGVITALLQRKKRHRWSANKDKRNKSTLLFLLTIDFNPDEVGARHLIQIIEEYGRYTTTLIRGSNPSQARESKATREADRWQGYLAISALFGLPVLLTAFVFPQFDDTKAFLDREITSGLTIKVFMEWMLSTPIQLGVGYPLYASALKALLYGRTVNMDTLVMLSTTTAYVYSIVATILSMTTSYDGDTFFETSAILLMLIMLGRYLEVLAKSKTSDVLTKLMELQADSATLLTKKDQNNEDEEGYIEQEIPIELVERGDIIKVLPGSKVPIDGIVVFGSSLIDESMVTGESMPVEKDVGDVVYGGTVNANGVLHVRTTATVGSSMVASIGRMVEEAQSSKPAIQRLADKVSLWFVPFVLLLTLVVLCIWFPLAFTDSVDRDGMAATPFALQFGIAVLVVSCPCAIGLAAPTAIMVGSSVAARRGILFKGGAPILEAAHSIDCILFDKTGTLTLGKPSLSEFDFFGDMSDNETELWSMIGSAESGSEHPLAKAITEYSKTKLAEYEGGMETAEAFEAVPGKGISCSIGGREVRIGNRAFIINNKTDEDNNDKEEEERVIEIPQQHNKRAKGLEREGKTVVWVAVDGALQGWMALADSLKPEAKGVVSYLQKRGVEVRLISGDNPRTVEAVGWELGIPNPIGGVLPKDKAEKVKEIQRHSTNGWLRTTLLCAKKGRVVAMVGDGINDSPALAQADVGVAVNAGTDIALEAADVVLVKNDLRDLLVAMNISKVTYRVILGNLLWAFLYNATAIPLAAGILYPAAHYALPPALAGLSELLSSLPVVLFSLLLRFYHPPPSIKKLYK